MKFHLRATGCHLPKCLMRSDSVTFHPTQVNIPLPLNLVRGRCSIYLPLRDGRLS